MTLIINYIIVILTVLVVPLTALLQQRYVRAKQSQVKKIRLYVLTTSLLWIITILVLQSDQQQVWYKPLLGNFSLWMSIITIVAFIYILITSILPYLLLKNEAFKDQFLALFSERQYLYPNTYAEKIVFLYASITIGITEEIIYRFFFVQFVHSFGAHALLAIFVSAAIFAVTHYLQGKEGIVQSFIFALAMSGLFVWTEHIIWPILIHTIFNMRMIWLSYKAGQLKRETHNQS